MHKQYLHYLILIIITIILFAPGISKIPPIDRDEAHFAQATRQMLQTGNFFQIRFQEKTRFQKPPGINWLQAAAVKLFSDAENNKIWPYRLPSLISAILSILACYFFTKKIINKKIALISSILLASSVLLVIEAHQAVIDATLLFSILLMQGSLWLIYQRSFTIPVNNYSVTHNFKWAFVFWLAMTIGIVLKGITPLVGLLTIAALCYQEKDYKWLKNLHIFSGLTILTGLTLSWLILVNNAEHSNYLLKMINHDLLPKLRGGHESHGQPPLFHLALLPLTFWPGSLFLVPAIFYAIHKRKENTTRFLLAWIIPTWIFFELMPTKLPQYLLPIFPAIAILCALTITNNKKKYLSFKGLRSLQIIWGIFSGITGIIIILLCYFLLDHIALSALFSFVIIAITVITALHCIKKSMQYAMLTLLAGSLCLYPLIFNILLPSLQPLWLTKALLKDVNIVNKIPLSAEQPLLVVGFDEPSLVFNINTWHVKFTSAELAQQLMQQNHQFLILTTPDILAQWSNLPLTVIAKNKGYNYNKGRWIELLLIQPAKNYYDLN